MTAPRCAGLSFTAQRLPQAAAMCVTVLYGVAPASTITAHARMQAVLNGLFGLVVWVWAFGGRTTREQRPRRRLG